MLDRYPPLYAFLVLPYYLMAALWVRARIGHSPSGAVLGFFAFWSFFLFLRVVDEHRDAETDREAHPERAGLVSQRELRFLGAAALTCGAGWTLWIGGPVLLVAWAIIVGWSFLAGSEFFQPVAWTYRHSVVFTASHLVIMPLALLWVLLVLGERSLGVDAIEISALALLAGAVFEIARKTWAPDEETKTDYTYSKVWGFGPSIGVIGVLAVSLMAVAIHLGGRVAGRFGLAWNAAVVLSLVVFLAWLVQFAKAPSKARRKRMEKSAGILIMLSAWSVVLRWI
jgi:hypothetical protein